MPTHCCVLLCTKKGYQDEVTGAKISYFRLPTKENQRKQWIQAIRRDLGKKFSTSNSTKVCSRHFKDEDFKITLTHVVSLKPGVVPSGFAWKRSSPRKRPLPAPRLTNKKEILIEKATERNSVNCRNFCRNFKSDIFDLEPPVIEADFYFPECQSVEDAKNLWTGPDCCIVIQEQEIGGRGFAVGRKLLWFKSDMRHTQ